MQKIIITIIFLILHSCAANKEVIRLEQVRIRLLEEQRIRNLKIEGCSDKLADNYNYEASIDNSSCRKTTSSTYSNGALKSISIKTYSYVKGINMNEGVSKTVTKEKYSYADNSVNFDIEQIDLKSNELYLAIDSLNNSISILSQYISNNSIEIFKEYENGVLSKVKKSKGNNLDFRAEFYYDPETKMISKVDTYEKDGTEYQKESFEMETIHNVVKAEFHEDEGRKYNVSGYLNSIGEKVGYWKINSVSDSNKKISEGEYDINQKVGDWKYFQKDNQFVEYINTIKDGKVVKKQYFYYYDCTNKKCSNILEYKSTLVEPFVWDRDMIHMLNGTYQIPAGTKTGEFLWYTEKGIIEKKGNYLNDNKVGVWSFYDEKGNLVKTCDYDDYTTFRSAWDGSIQRTPRACLELSPDGIINGHWEKHSDSGVLLIKGNYNEGYKDSEWLKWYENGNKKTTGSYKMGKKDGLWTFYKESGYIEYAKEYTNGEGEWAHFGGCTQNDAKSFFINRNRTAGAAISDLSLIKATFSNQWYFRGSGFKSGFFMVFEGNVSCYDGNYKMDSFDVLDSHRY